MELIDKRKLREWWRKHDAAAGIVDQPKRTDLVIDAILEHGPMHPPEIAEKTGLKLTTCITTCYQMVNLGDLYHTGKTETVCGRLFQIYRV